MLNAVEEVCNESDVAKTANTLAERKSQGNAGDSPRTVVVEHFALVRIQWHPMDNNKHASVQSYRFHFNFWNNSVWEIEESAIFQSVEIIELSSVSRNRSNVSLNVLLTNGKVQVHVGRAANIKTAQIVINFTCE